MLFDSVVEPRNRCDTGVNPFSAGNQRCAAPKWRPDLLVGEAGSVTILVAVAIAAILGIIGLAIDVGQLRLAKQRLQTTADAAALAGALELRFCAGTANCSVLTAAAQDALTENAFTGSTLLTNCAAGSTTSLTITVNNGPCALGSANPHNGNLGYVETVISQPQPTYFVRILGITSVLIQARAEASPASSHNCVYTLGASGTDILINGSGNLTMQSCGVVDDSSASQALLVNGSAHVLARSIGIVGHYQVNGSVVLKPTPNVGITSVSDPLASLPSPTFSANSCQANPSINGSGSFSIGPAIAGGTVCYKGLTINGTPNVTLSPGLYIIDGAVVLNGSGSITGTGVTLYFPSGGSYTDNGSETLNLTAPTSGTYDGILFYQDRSNKQQVIFNGSSNSSINGIFYAPSASVTINGSGSTTWYTSLIFGSLTFNGSGTIKDYSTINLSSPLNSGAVLTQ